VSSLCFILTCTGRLDLRIFVDLPLLESLDPFRRNLGSMMEEHSLLSLAPGSVLGLGNDDLHAVCRQVLLETPFFEFLFPFSFTIGIRIKHANNVATRAITYLALNPCASSIFTIVISIVLFSARQQNARVG
jgi:hypothetical protein